MKMAHKNKISSLINIGILLLFVFQCYPSQAQTIFKVPKYPYETCIADYDQDGDNDIIVGCNFSFEDDSIVLFVNDGWGNFEKLQFAANGAGFIYCEDLDNDGYPDIITRDADSIFFYKNDQNNGIADAYFIRDAEGNPFIGGIADIDLDSYSDIIYYNKTNPFGWGVLFNNGDCSFTDSSFVESSDSWLRPSIGQLNNDNQPDILVTTLVQTDSVHVLYNNYPDFLRNNLATADWAEGYTTKTNNDSLNDITLYRPLYIGPTWITSLINKGDHFHTCDTLEFVNGTSIKTVNDFNRDGYDDFAMLIYQANNLPVEDSVYIYFNDGYCGLTHEQSIYVGDYFWLATISSGDLNGNGYPDLVVRGFSMPTPDYIRILWNDGTGHFIDTNSVYVFQNEKHFSNEIHIYPNPSPGSISINPGAEKITALRIVDLKGSTLVRWEFSSSQNKITLDLRIPGIKPGIYICIIELENEDLVFKKLIINKPN
ncbi:MAG: T9SS type A sorting domain-containing protein [Bacteroidales bacterium]|nr:T9SS type A sorting domain-containing protein [Bacteroidales bacterium]MCF6341301.1 T9SS type A sorting domain-containing protein [Bacteroidales bacterium]